MDIDDLVEDAQRYLDVGRKVASRTLIVAAGIAVLFVAGLSVLTGSVVVAIIAAIIAVIPLFAIWLLTRDLDFVSGLPDRVDNIWDDAKPELQGLLEGKKHRGGIFGLSRAAKVGKAMAGTLKSDVLGTVAGTTARLNPARFGFAALAIAALPFLAFIGGITLLLGLIF